MCIYILHIYIYICIANSSANAFAELFEKAFISRSRAQAPVAGHPERPVATYRPDLLFLNRGASGGNFVGFLWNSINASEQSCYSFVLFVVIKRKRACGG